MRDYLVRRQASILRAMGHPVRLKIIGLLSSGPAGTERCVCEIIPAVGVDQSTVSKHLAILRGQGILTARREGRRVLYSLAHPMIGRMVRLAEDLCQAELAETRRLVATLRTANDTDWRD